MKPLPKTKPRLPMSEAEFAEVERRTIYLAEVRAREAGASVEWVLGMAFTDAATSGRAPLEMLYHSWTHYDPEEQYGHTATPTD